MQALLRDRKRLVMVEILRHLIERAGEYAELVRRARGHSCVEVTRRELPHAAGQRAEPFRHAVRNRHDADDREADDEETERQVAHGCTPNLAPRLAEQPGDAERQSRLILLRHDHPVAHTARFVPCAFCCTCNESRLAR